MPAPSSLLALLVAFAAAALCATAAGQQRDDLRYGRDIRPLLSDRCFRCHGPDANTREAGLRLDLREAAVAMRADGAAIVPGDADASLLWQRVNAHGTDEQMPPASSGKPALRPDELALVRRWIDAGAQYEPHWAFVPPQPVDVPADAGAHPVDAFLERARRERSLTSNPPADRATLCRRVFLVLTGLPPTPEELDAFAADDDEGAYERLVDRLLHDEPYVTRHAEHLAGIWLDAGRYADTSGIHMDAGRQAWLWRDWLIAALRDDMPLDQFVVEQLAGDLLPDATPQQQVATGFLRNHVTTDEGGAIDAEYLVEYAAERTATVGSVFLGLTVGCARCHDHKYDPISQRDYYRLFSFFNNNDEPGLYSQSPDAERALEPKLAVPADAQATRREALQNEVAGLEQQLHRTTPDEQRAYRAFLHELQREQQLAWHTPVVTRAESRGGATLTIHVDGSVLASGESPADDTHVLTFRTDAEAQRWLCLEALTDASLPEQRVGRASHGNVVLQYLKLEQRPFASVDGEVPEWTEVPLIYALADVEQSNGDFVVGNVLDDDTRGWAPAGHQGAPGPRTALLLAERPFGAVGGAELRLTLKYDSRYKQHVFGRVRVRTAGADPDGLQRLPVAASGKHVIGPFVPDDLEAAGPTALYDTDFGPQALTALDDAQTFGDRAWRFDSKWSSEGPHGLAGGRNVHYVAQRLWLPTARRCEVALGSDDGFQLFVDGQRVAERRVDRGVAVDQDRRAFELDAGAHLLVLKVVNTNGAGGFALRHVGRERELAHELCLVMLPGFEGDRALQDRVRAAWHEDFSPTHRRTLEQLAQRRDELSALEAAIPEAMVMRERAAPRPTFLLMRGEYDKADESRPVRRELPAMFGALPADAPKDRLGLARWLVGEQDPLLLRVVANRLWEFVFGVGIVRTSEDFGLQGEWPSHPELLDWLALELRRNGHSTRELLRLLVTSAAFRQDARRNEAADVDPDDRLLCWFPRRRLTAEAIRDQALFAAGLLVERTGGASVKPYQPPGLWREVAMVQSNTRTFVRGDGDALWRRSLYTYWKRACPPPGLTTFDAPTREFCTIRRSTTNTPLQALVLWNDEQFVEAARVLATRALRGAVTPQDALRDMHRRLTGGELDGARLDAAAEALQRFTARYQQDVDAAKQLLEVGETPADATLDPARLAALTMLASAFLDLDATLYID